jgi:hypothetical protein
VRCGSGILCGGRDPPQSAADEARLLSLVDGRGRSHPGTVRRRAGRARAVSRPVARCVVGGLSSSAVGSASRSSGSVSEVSPALAQRPRDSTSKTRTVFR